MGFRVLAVDSCREALQAVRASRPDLVVIDPHLGHYLKDAKGVWTLCRIKEQDASIPVVMHTEYALDEGDPRCRAADACVRKGADLEPLKRTVQDVLRRQPEGAAC